jgi:hypothetical protein
MIRIEIDDDSLSKQLRDIAEATISAQRGYREQYDALLPEARKDVPEPLLETREQVFQRVFQEGLTRGASTWRGPNSIINMKARPLRYEGGRRIEAPPLARGEQLQVAADLPIGSQLVSIEASASDGPMWDVEAFSVGPVRLLEWGTEVPLSSLLRLSRTDLLETFANRRTIYDTQVEVWLRAKVDNATFEGYRIFLFSEEKVCAAASFLESAPCDHPEDSVRPIHFVEVVRDYVYGPLLRGTLRGPTPLPLPGSTPTPGLRWRCMKCGREVQRIAFASSAPKKQESQ